MTDSIRIRKATDEDVPAIVELWQELMKFHGDRDDFFEVSDDGPSVFAGFIECCLISEQHRLTLAEKGKRIIGYCLAAQCQYPPVYRNRNYAEVIDLAVTSEHRGRGAGTAMVEELIRYYNGIGINRIECRVAITNEISTRFWRKMGFGPFMEILCANRAEDSQKT